MSTSEADLRYPIGPLKIPGETTPQQRREWLNALSDFPRQLQQATDGLSAAQLDTRYRPDGWTVRQVVHHVADSHMNAYIRVRLALTEEAPVIKPYYEDRWAELLDGRTADISLSLQILDALHKRWTLLYGSFGEAEFARMYRHPEMGELRMDQVLALYAWHCEHHMGHITGLRTRSGW